MFISNTNTEQAETSLHKRITLNLPKLFSSCLTMHLHLIRIQFKILRNPACCASAAFSDSNPRIPCCGHRGQAHFFPVKLWTFIYVFHDRVAVHSTKVPVGRGVWDSTRRPAPWWMSLQLPSAVVIIFC